ncbi:MAG: hypothetical protein JW816_01710 [Candidatus Buchananbacteria bacterium]|nr:hypothetical protein [Candidatus Buchananbacteria bacterium]
MTGEVREEVKGILGGLRLTGQDEKIRVIFRHIWPGEGDCSRFLSGILELRPEVLLPISQSVTERFDLSEDPDLAMLLAALWLKDQYNKA